MRSALSLVNDHAHKVLCTGVIVYGEFGVDTLKLPDGILSVIIPPSPSICPGQKVNRFPGGELRSPRLPLLGLA